MCDFQGFLNIHINATSSVYFRIILTIGRSLDMFACDFKVTAQIRILVLTSFMESEFYSLSKAFFNGIVLLDCIDGYPRNVMF